MTGVLAIELLNELSSLFTQGPPLSIITLHRPTAPESSRTMSSTTIAFTRRVTMITLHQVAPVHFDA
jgi:hypothetical protein